MQPEYEGQPAHPRPAIEDQGTGNTISFSPRVVSANRRARHDEKRPLALYAIPARRLRGGATCPYGLTGYLHHPSLSMYNLYMPKKNDKRDEYGLKSKSDSELYQWLSLQKEGSEEYNAGIRETMERIAIVEERAERDDPALGREKFAIFVAFLAIVITIVTIVISQP